MGLVLSLVDVWYVHCVPVQTRAECLWLENLFEKKRKKTPFSHLQRRTAVAFTFSAKDSLSLRIQTIQPSQERFSDPFTVDHQQLFIQVLRNQNERRECEVRQAPTCSSWPSYILSLSLTITLSHIPAGDSQGGHTTQQSLQLSEAILFMEEEVEQSVCVDLTGDS